MNQILGLAPKEKSGIELIQTVCRCKKRAFLVLTNFESFIIAGPNFVQARGPLKTVRTNMAYLGTLIAHVQCSNCTKSYIAYIIMSFFLQIPNIRI